MSQQEQVERIAHLSPPYAPGVGRALELMTPNSRGVEPLKLFRTFVKDLPLTVAMGGFGRFMLTGRASGGAAFDLRTRELVIDRVTARCRCEYEWGVHVAGYAEKAGLTDDEVHSLVYGSGSDECWSAKDRAVIDMVDELHDGAQLTDPTYAAVVQFFDETQLIELFMLAGWYHSISYLANGARTELEDWAARFPARREG